MTKPPLEGGRWIQIDASIAFRHRTTSVRNFDFVKTREWRRRRVLPEFGGRKYGPVDLVENIASIYYESIVDLSFPHGRIRVCSSSPIQGPGPGRLISLFLSVDLHPSQMVRVGFSAKRWENGADGIDETKKYVKRKLGAVLRGEEIDSSEPPPLEVSCTHFSSVRSTFMLWYSYHRSWKSCHSQIQSSHSTRKTLRISFSRTNESSSNGSSRERIGAYRAPLITRFSHYTIRLPWTRSFSGKYPLRNGPDMF